MNPIFSSRRSVRAFRQKEIEEEKIKEILEAADCAPSAGNLKAREIIIVKDAAAKKALAEAAYDQNFISQASAVFVFCAIPEISGKKYGERGKQLYSLQDATIAATFAWLEAVNQGLSACWVGAFDEDKVCEILNIKQTNRPIVILPVGYAR